jgi:hypothetical protein
MQYRRGMKEASYRALVGLVAASTLLLGGCASADPEAEPTPKPSSSRTMRPSPTPTPTATPEPTATPSATPTAAPTTAPEAALPRKPALDSLVVTTAGIGSLRVGHPVTETDMVAYDADFCAEGGAGPAGDPRFGRWAHTYDEFSSGWPFGVRVAGETVERIDILEAPLKTREGAGRGSTVQQLQAAYPGLERGTSTPLVDVYFIRDAAGSIVFEVANGTTTDYYLPEEIGTVILFRVIAPGVNPDASVAGGGDIAGGC